MHLSCLIETFKDAGNESMRNKIEWLHDFVKYFSLMYLYKACCEKYSATSKFVDRTILAVNSKTLDPTIGRQMEELRIQVVGINDQMRIMQTLEQSFSDTGSKIKKMQNELNCKLSLTMLPVIDDNDVKDIADGNIKAGNIASSSAAKLHKSQSYAQVLTKNITDTITSFVVDTLKQQRQHERDGVSVVVYGMTGRENNDMARATKIL